MHDESQQFTLSRDQHPLHQRRRRPRTKQNQQQQHPRRRPHLPSSAAIAAVAIAACFIWPRSGLHGQGGGVDAFVMSLRPASRMRTAPKSLEAVSGRTRRMCRASSMVSAVDKVATTAASAAKEGVVGSSLGDRLRADFPILDQVGPCGRGGTGGWLLLASLHFLH